MYLKSKKLVNLSIMFYIIIGRRRILCLNYGFLVLMSCLECSLIVVEPEIYFPGHGAQMTTLRWANILLKNSESCRMRCDDRTVKMQSAWKLMMILI